MAEAEIEKGCATKKKHKPHKPLFSLQKVTNEEIKTALSLCLGMEHHAAIWLGNFKTKQKEVECAKLGIPFNEKTDAIKISRQAIHKRIMRSQELRAVQENCGEVRLDIAESKLMELVNEKNLGAICFLLKCQGKKRGWIERQELTGADGETLSTVGLNIAFTDKAGAGDGEASTDS